MKPRLDAEHLEDDASYCGDTVDRQIIQRNKSLLLVS